MIIDARELAPGTTVEADLCIVGSGPAGIAVARRFLDRDFRVVVLEAGGGEESPASQAFYEGENLGLPYDLTRSRFRMYGGSGSQWGGYCAMLDPADFERHDWIPLSGWPLTYDALRPYYGRAIHWLGFAEPDFDPNHWAAQGEAVVRFPGDEVRNKIWRFHRYRFGEAHREEFAASGDVQILLHAPLTGIETNAARDQVTGVVVQPTRDRRLEVRARRFVLACGGLETPRILLTAGPGHTPLIDNENVGRFFMEHFHVKWKLEIALFAEVARSRLYQVLGLTEDCCEVRAFFQLAPEIRREHGLTNLAFKVYRDADDGLVGRAAGALENRLRGREGEIVTASLAMMAEQVPNPSSRVTLSDERDPLGVPRLRLDWRSTALDNDSVYRSALLLAAKLGESGAGRVRLLPGFEALEYTTDFDGDVEYGSHHMGTARMSATPRQGVVDTDCRVHGIDNLYLAGSAVFPTSGCANPTLTIVALALRLADHLAASPAG